MKRDYEILKRIGERIRLIRIQKGLSQSKLARIAHVSPSYLSEIERGLKNVSCIVLFRVIDKLEIGVVLFDGISDSKINLVMQNLDEIVRILKNM